jgi:hypothetical protein
MNSMTPVMFMVMLCVMYMWYLYFVSCVVYVWRMYGVLRVVCGLGVLSSFRAFYSFFFSSFYSGLHLSVGISGVGNYWD